MTDPKDTNPSSTATWSYDESGNRNVESGSQGTTTYTANSINQYTAITGAQSQGPLAYSPRGDLIENGDWSYTFDADGNLIRAHNSQSNMLAKYCRDAAGHRAVKDIDGEKTLYFNFGFWPLEAYDLSAETTRSTIYAPGLDNPLCEINDDGTVRFFYHQDWLGNVALLTDPTGATLQTYTYDVWGEPSGFNATGNPIAASAYESHFLFTGREYDQETGLYHYRARSYSPSLGRFLQFDPIDFAGGDANLVRYVLNNSVNLVDPSGKFIPQLVAGAALAVLTGVGAIMVIHNLSEALKKGKKERDELECKQSGGNIDDPFGVEDEILRRKAVEESINNGATRDAGKSGGGLGPSSPIPSP